jgi:hypothetical protein
MANDSFKRDSVNFFLPEQKDKILENPHTYEAFREKARVWKFVDAMHSKSCKSMAAATLTKLRHVAQHSSDKYVLLLIDSLVIKGTATWINGYPNSKRTKMTDDEYRNAARLRLGLQYKDNMPRKCGNRQCNESLKDSPYHYYNCRHIHGGMWNLRHDDVRDTILSTASAAGYRVMREPHHGLGSQRTDLYIHSRDSSDVIGDVTITNTCSLRRSATQQMKHAAANKNAKYSDPTAMSLYPSDTRFAPLVFSIFGGLTQETQRLITEISGHAMRSHEGNSVTWSFSQFIQQFVL